MRYAWIERHRDDYAVSRMCRLLAVSRTGYLQRRRRPPSARAQANARLDAQVEVQETDNATFHCHAGGLVEPSYFHDAIFLGVARAVLGNGDLHPDTTVFREPSFRTIGLPVTQVNDEVELCVRSVTEGCHTGLL